MGQAGLASCQNQGNFEVASIGYSLVDVTEWGSSCTSDTTTIYLSYLLLMTTLNVGTDSRMQFKILMYFWI